jgi:putative transcriptional regulator
VTRQRADPAASQQGGLADETPIRVHLDEMLSQRGLTLTELSARVDITIVNLSILKNGRARAIRFSTMARLCEALHCQPGDLLSYQPPAARQTGTGPHPRARADSTPAAPATAQPRQDG